MNQSFWKNTFAVIFMFLFLFNNIKADRKYFGYSYLSYTLPAKEFELEFWQTGKFGKSTGSFFAWQPQIEFEYGVTDRLTTSLYLDFTMQKSSGNEFNNVPFKFSKASLEFRYRITTPGEYFLDPALYFEISYNKDVTEYEPKILLTKRFGRFVSGINLAAAIEKENNGDETETEFVLSAGIAYELTNQFALGLEFRDQRIFSEFYEKELNQAYYLGPTINYSGNGFGIVLSMMAQIAGSPSNNGALELIKHEKYQARAILSIDL